MRSKLAGNRSSRLVILPAIIVFLILGLIAAYFGQSFLAAVLLLLFLFSLIARLWAESAGRGLSVRLGQAPGGMFPGDKVRIELSIRNGKLLPLLWSEVYLPLSDDLCMLPEETRVPDEWEKVDLTEGGYHTELIGEIKSGAFLWYEERTVSLNWTAKSRGIYSTSGWSLRTGDGFGLSQTQFPLEQSAPHRFAIYPALVPVDSSLFLRNQWNAETGAKGIMEDPTVIRSTRPYQVTDSARRINWRLAARGLPLAVNVYEDILPRSVHFIVDGDSFGGPTAHPEELEETLSILASELLALSDAQVKCGLSICAGARSDPRCLSMESDTAELLWALAAYRPLPPLKATDDLPARPRTPLFDTEALAQAEPHTGRFYYIAFNAETAAGRTFLRRFESLPMTLLTYEDPGNAEWDAVCLRNLRTGGGNT